MSAPADLLPGQIAEALRELSRRDSVGIYVDTSHGSPCYFHVIETLEEQQRSGFGADYDVALAGCRAAAFEPLKKVGAQ